MLKTGKKSLKEIKKESKKRAEKTKKRKDSSIRPIVSHEDMIEGQAQAQKIGIKGEFIVDAYFKSLQQNDESFSFEWISKKDSTSPYDFWIYQNGEKILIDVKSTSGAFDNIIHISLSELRQMVAGKNRYDIYRVFDISEVNKSAKLRIAKDIKSFAKAILKIFDQLPGGILVDSISVPLHNLSFEETIWVIEY
jgi:hypothetical protein